MNADDTAVQMLRDCIKSHSAELDRIDTRRHALLTEQQKWLDELATRLSGVKLGQIVSPEELGCFGDEKFVIRNISGRIVEVQTPRLVVYISGNRLKKDGTPGRRTEYATKYFEL